MGFSSGFTNITPGAGSSASGTGDVTGPSTSTQNAIATFSNTTGKILSGTQILVDTTGSIFLQAGRTVDGRDLSVDGQKLDGLPTSAIQAVSANSGTSITSRGVVNFISGTGTTVTATDDSVGLKSDVQFSLSTAFADLMYRDVVTTTSAAGDNVRTLSFASVGSYIIDVEYYGRLTVHDGSLLHYVRRMLVENTGGTVTARTTLTPTGMDFEATTPTNLTAATGPVAPTISTTNLTIRVQGAAGTNLTWTIYTRVRNAS